MGQRPTLTRAAHVFIGRVPSGCGAKGQGASPQGPMAPWGGIHSREARMGVDISPLFPRYVLPDGPPDSRGPLEVLVGLDYVI